MAMNCHRVLVMTVLLSFTVSFQSGAAEELKEGCSLPQTPYNGNFEVEGCEGILKDPFSGVCWKNPKIKYPIGQVVNYFCNTNFVLRGKNKLTCLSPGNWSHPFPRCCKLRAGSSQLGQTGDLNNTNGLATIKRQVSLDVFEKAKERSFEATDEEGISCPPLLKTNNVEFECMGPDGRLSDCQDPPFPAYTVAHLKCAKFYRSAGDLAYRYRKCKPDGSWSTEGTITCISDCGQSNSAKKPLITNGLPSERGQWPWHVAIYFRTKGTWTYICGGSLISNRVILTAAHCVTQPLTEMVTDASKLVTVLGKFTREFDSTDTNEQIKYVKKIIVHPNYSSLNFESDIALIILNTPVEYTFYVRPVCFPEDYNSLIEEYQIQEGNYGTVIGWGLNENGQLSQKLSQAQLPVVGSRICIDSYKEFFQAQTRYTNFCAGYTNGTGVCNGDSGGGMVFPSGDTDHQRWYIQGIVSVGAPDPDDTTKCNMHQYSLFTRVGRFSDWIVRTLTPDGLL